jgi:hypothetical protein
MKFTFTFTFTFNFTFTHQLYTCDIWHAHDSGFFVPSGFLRTFIYLQKYFNIFENTKNSRQKKKNYKWSQVNHIKHSANTDSS